MTDRPNDRLIDRPMYNVYKYALDPVDARPLLLLGGDGNARDDGHVLIVRREHRVAS